MPLEFVEPDPNPNINVLLYGAPKSGKSVGAASAPGPILYVNADRPNATQYAHSQNPGKIKEVRPTGLSTLVDVVQELDANPDDYETVVVDPIGELYRTVLEDLSGRALAPQIQHYGDTNTHVERFCRALCEMPFNVVLCFHELRSKDDEAGNFERVPYTGTNNPALGAKLMGMVDIVGYTGVVKDDNGQVNYLTQLVDGRGRRGGDRFGVLGVSRETDLSEWFSLIRGEDENKKEAE